MMINMELLSNPWLVRHMLCLYAQEEELSSLLFQKFKALVKVQRKKASNVLQQ